MEKGNLSTLVQRKITEKDKKIFYLPLLLSKLNRMNTGHHLDDGDYQQNIHYNKIH